MSTPRIHNDTDFVVEPHLLLDRDGEKLCAIVKATFELSSGKPHPVDGSFVVAPRERRRGVRAIDLPWGKPQVSSIRYPSDLCVRKPGAEVIVVASAHAPDARPVASFDAGVRVGRLSKVVRVTGPRVWQQDGGGVSEPTLLTSLELRYEHAFGGAEHSPDQPPLEDPRNPVGRGITRKPGSLTLSPAPQIEDPGAPIRNASSRPKPAGLGPIGRSWEPRRGYWGSYGGDWLTTRSPLPPADFDDRANFSAPQELIAALPFEGGEECAVTNLTRGGGLVSFRLPTLRLFVTFRAKGQEAVELAVRPDTLVIDTILLPPPAPIARGQAAWICPLTIELVGRVSVAAPRRWSSGEIALEERRKR